MLYIWALIIKTIAMSEGFTELLKLAKQKRVTTYDELMDIVDECKNQITGSDVECVRLKLKIKMF